jgi:hypothetical protein
MIDQPFTQTGHLFVLRAQQPSLHVAIFSEAVSPGGRS